MDYVFDVHYIANVLVYGTVYVPPSHKINRVWQNYVKHAREIEINVGFVSSCF